MTSVQFCIFDLAMGVTDLLGTEGPKLKGELPYSVVLLAGLWSRQFLRDSDSNSGLKISTPTPTPTLLRLQPNKRHYILNEQYDATIFYTFHCIQAGDR